MNVSAHDKLQETLAYYFSDFTQLNSALTHPSFNNEEENCYGDYQRLEFLGDAILGMLLAEMLFFRYPEAAEGELSRTRALLAEQSSLAAIAREHGIGKFIRVGRGEELSSGRDKDSILCDVLEALIAAVYLDGGLDATRHVVARFFNELLEAPLEQASSRDAKSELQELLSARCLAPPEYRLTAESGPPHDRQFSFVVLIDDQVYGEGQGRSKKIAQQAAAICALDLLESKGELAI